MERPQRKQPETLRLRGIMPSITCNDIDRSLAWYRDVIGFMVEQEMEHDGRVVGAVLKAGSAQMFIGQDDFAKGSDRPKGVGLRFYCVTVQDIDALAAAIRDNGGVLAEEPQDQSWGTRDFAVVDPDGFKITFTSPPPEA